MKGKVSMNRSRTTERTFIYRSMRMKSREKKWRRLSVTRAVTRTPSLPVRIHFTFRTEKKKEVEETEEGVHIQEERAEAGTQTYRLLLRSSLFQKTQILSKGPTDSLLFQPIVSFVFRASCPESECLSLEADTERDNKVLWCKKCLYRKSLRGFHTYLVYFEQCNYRKDFP